MRIGLKIKSTFRLSNTAMTTQKALFTCLFQPPDTPFLTTPLLKTNWVQDPRRASVVRKNHVPDPVSSQPLHLDPIPQCPRMSNLAISCPTLREFQVTILQQVTYCHFTLPKRISYFQERSIHAYISKYSSIALHKWPYASNTSHRNTDPYQNTAKTTWMPSTDYTPTQGENESCSDRIHCQQKPKTQLLRPSHKCSA